MDLKLLLTHPAATLKFHHLARMVTVVLILSVADVSKIWVINSTSIIIVVY